MAKKDKHVYVRVAGDENVHGVKDGAIVRVKDRIGGIVIVMVPDKMLISPAFHNEQAIPYTLVTPYDDKLLESE